MKVNTLFTSVGRRVSLLQYFKAELQRQEPGARLIAVDMQSSAAAMSVADVRVMVPRAADPDYVGRLLEVCDRNAVGLLIPLIDTDLGVLAEHRAAFEERGVRVLISSPEAIRITEDKRETHRFFDRIGVASPDLEDPACLPSAGPLPHPVIVKPVNGSASEHVFVAQTGEELAFFTNYVQDPIIERFIDGDEYTVDVLVDFEGVVRCAIPRLRLETRAGEVSKGRTVRRQDLIEAVENIVTSLPGAVGPLNVQCFVEADGSIVFTEINPRFGGGYPLSHAAGADFPRWLLTWHRGEDGVYPVDAWTDGLVMLRYDEAIFLQPEVKPA